MQRYKNYFNKYQNLLKFHYSEELQHFLHLQQYNQQYLFLFQGLKFSKLSNTDNVQNIAILGTNNCIDMKTPARRLTPSDRNNIYV